MPQENETSAPGAPGIPGRWTSSAKSGVGTALNPASHVWFTLSHGILNEVYYPRIDQACTRDLGMIVTDGREFFSEEKRGAVSQVSRIADSAPAYRVVSTCRDGRYRIEKEILSDPMRDVVLQRTIFTPLRGGLADYRLYALLASHLANFGSGNTAWVGDYKGAAMLFAQRGPTALALACSVPWLRLSVGYVGSSDGWQDLSRHKRMAWSYTLAEDGNVALTGEIDLAACVGDFVLALGFGRNAAEAGHRAVSSLLDGFDAARSGYVRDWEAWQHSLAQCGTGECSRPELYRVSAQVLRAHEAPNFPGGTIASLSVPWGFAKGDDDLGGYHLVWPRDLVETAGGLLAAGAYEDARRTIRYLQVTQEADGHWSQNTWLDGTPYWSGVQMDETALPILLVDLAQREGALPDGELTRFWSMVRKAAAFLVCNGPVTQEDRWEEDPGYSPFTLAAQIAALLAAADLADLAQEASVAAYLRETADLWNDSIERWIYVEGTELARQVGVRGYYVRVAPPEEAEGASPAQGFVPIKNRPPSDSSKPAAQIVSPDALALVRFGVRAPDDARIVDTLRVIDSLLKVDTPSGPAWHRYNDDGYGEHDDGSPFDGTGVGRLWPLLTGERAHYELAAGRKEEAVRLLHTMESFANEGGMLPEQIWDSPDIPERELFFGRPSGSAMPLVWAHSEYIKLLHSLQDGRVFDMPPQTVRRYQVEKVRSPRTVWRFNHKCRSIGAGKTLRVETLAPSVIHWSTDGWREAHDAPMRDTGLGLYVHDLPTGDLAPGTQVVFTFYWPDTGRWEEQDYTMAVAEPGGG